MSDEVWQEFETAALGAHLRRWIESMAPAEREKALLFLEVWNDVLRMELRLIDQLDDWDAVRQFLQVRQDALLRDFPWLADTDD